MEPRSVIGEYDPASGRYSLRTGSGAGVVRCRERLALTLGVPLGHIPIKLIPKGAGL
jgi:hypothetical protein